MSEVFEEADLRAGFKAGGRLLGAFIVHRGESDFAVYVRGDWGRGRGFRIVKSWRGRAGDRRFRRLDTAWEFIRKMGWSGRVTVYPSGDEGLAAFAGVQEHDLQRNSNTAYLSLDTAAGG